MTCRFFPASIGVSTTLSVGRAGKPSFSELKSAADARPNLASCLEILSFSSPNSYDVLKRILRFGLSDLPALFKESINAVIFV
jgi:hypothetical protein